jgi:hypothetical protein
MSAQGRAGEGKIGVGKKGMVSYEENWELFSEMNYFAVFIRLPLPLLLTPQLTSPYYLLSPFLPPSRSSWVVSSRP